MIVLMFENANADFPIVFRFGGRVTELRFGVVSNADG